jgi:Flp pilus assembly protein TadD
MSVVLALLLAQVGPSVRPLPHERAAEPLRPPRRPEAQTQPSAPTTPSDQQMCLDLAENTPDEASDAAEAWLAKAQGPERALAGECLGIALTRQNRFEDAQNAFRNARDAATDKLLRARLGAMAGNAALAHGDAAAALAALDIAHDDAGTDKALAGGIAIDRARALVALKRNDEAAAALAEARTAQPDNAQAWLLSATLSRRMNKLAEAQAQIEKAAELLPVDPEIGLEAGVIAMLSGREAAARRSWQSVVTAAPDSEAAATAKNYLAQLSPAPAGTPSATKP